MNKLYYQPEGGWVGDIMPCYHNGQYFLYYQCDKRDPAPFPNGNPFGWSLVVTKDMIHFEDYGEVLKTGPRNTREECLYAGSVIHANGCFRAFYTGRCEGWYGPEHPPAEAVMFATSDDGIHWRKKEELTFTAPEGYEKDYFRDPYVFYYKEDDTWIMILPARKDEGPAIRRGVMLYYSSSDLEHWDFQGELWYPEMYHLLQMPDLFKIGDWWYLLFSEYCDERKTRYRMSRSIHGPWHVPPDDSLDSRCFYAARTIVVGDERYIFGWNPTRMDDLSMWIWGGTAIMHKIEQRTDGTLGVLIPPQYEAVFAPKAPLQLRELHLSRMDGCDEHTVLDDSSRNFRLDWKFKLHDNTQSFGIRFYMNSEQDIGYTFEFRPNENLVVFDKLPMQKWFSYMNMGMQRSLKMMQDRTYSASLIVDNDLAVLYVDDVAFDVRMCEKPGSELRMFVNAGSVAIFDIRQYGMGGICRSSLKMAK